MPQSDSAPEAVHRKTVPVDFPLHEFLFLDPAPPRKKPAPQIRGQLNRVAVSAARCVGQPSTPASAFAAKPYDLRCLRVSASSSISRTPRDPEIGRASCRERAQIS